MHEAFVPILAAPFAAVDQEGETTPSNAVLILVDWKELYYLQPEPAQVYSYYQLMF